MYERPGLPADNAAADSPAGPESPAGTGSPNMPDAVPNEPNEGPDTDAGPAPDRRDPYQPL